MKIFFAIFFSLLLGGFAFAQTYDSPFDLIIPDQEKIVIIDNPQTSAILPDQEKIVIKDNPTTSLRPTPEDWKTQFYFIMALAFIGASIIYSLRKSGTR